MIRGILTLIALALIAIGLTFTFIRWQVDGLSTLAIIGITLAILANPPRLLSPR